MAQEEASEKVEPGWRSSASPEEIVKRQEAAQERARDAGWSYGGWWKSHGNHGES
jgi:hypothetical protein